MNSWCRVAKFPTGRQMLIWSYGHKTSLASALRPWGTRQGTHVSGWWASTQALKELTLAARAYMTILGMFSFEHACLVLSFENFPRRTVDFGRLRRPTRFVAQQQDWHNSVILSLDFQAITDATCTRSSLLECIATLPYLHRLSTRKFKAKFLPLFISIGISPCWPGLFPLQLAL